MQLKSPNPRSSTNTKIKLGGFSCEFAKQDIEDAKKITLPNREKILQFVKSDLETIYSLITYSAFNNTSFNRPS